MLWHFPAAFGGKGSTKDAAIASEDLMPTLLDLCGVTTPKSVEGIDFAGYLRGGENPRPDNAALIECVAPFGQWTRENGGREYRGIRTQRYTYVRDLTGPWLLFDNLADPYQLHNLVNDSKAAELQGRLDAILKRQLQSAHDEFLPAEKYLAKWGYTDRVDATGTLPTKP